MVERWLMFTAGDGAGRDRLGDRGVRWAAAHKEADPGEQPDEPPSAHP